MQILVATLMMMLMKYSSSSAYLCLYSLAGIHQQQRTLAGRKAARHLQRQQHPQAIRWVVSLLNKPTALLLHDSIHLHTVWYLLAEQLHVG
jgi:hypothetical protein